MRLHHQAITSSLLFLLCVGCGVRSDPPGAELINPGAGGSSSGGTAASGADAGLGGSSSSPTAGYTSAGGSVAGGSVAGGSAAGGSSAGGTTGVGGIQGHSGASGAPVTCGTRTAQRGKTSRTVMVNGTSRTFIAYLPESLAPTTNAPLVYVFHGAMQTGANMFEMTQYSELADKEKIAVVFADGQGTSSASGTGNLAPWNVSDGTALCGLGTLVSNPNPVDFPFLDAIKTELLDDQCIDPAHVFATGFSMGGYFSHHIGCERSDFRAVAPHSGATMADLSSCKTQHMPIIIFHGLADTLINAGCSDPNASQQLGFPAAATLWAKKNGCQNTFKTVVEKGTTTGKDGNCYLYDGCPADGQVELCTFADMPHAWAGAMSCPGCIGSGAGYASATQLEWDFFKKYAW